MTATGTTMVPASINDRIDLACRALKHLGKAETFVEIADALGISDSYLANIRSGNKTVSDDYGTAFLKKLCEAFDVTLRDLFDEDIQAAVGTSEYESEMEPVSEPEPESEEVPDDVFEADAVERTDRIDIEHGSLFFHAVRDEDGDWRIHAKVHDDEIVRILAMHQYREMFGGFVTLDPTDEEE